MKILISLTMLAASAAWGQTIQEGQHSVQLPIHVPPHPDTSIKVFFGAPCDLEGKGYSNLATGESFVCSQGMMKPDISPAERGQWKCPGADPQLINCMAPDTSIVLVEGARCAVEGMGYSSPTGERLVCSQGMLKKPSLGESSHSWVRDCSAWAGDCASARDKGKTIKGEPPVWALWKSVIAPAVIGPGEGLYEYSSDGITPPRPLTPQETVQWYEKFLREDADQLQAKDVEIQRQEWVIDVVNQQAEANMRVGVAKDAEIARLKRALAAAKKLQPITGAKKAGQTPKNPKIGQGA